MGLHDLEHISSILSRAIEALEEEWKRQRKGREVQYEVGGVSGFGQPGTHAARSPFPLAWGEASEIKKKRWQRR